MAQQRDTDYSLSVALINEFKRRNFFKRKYLSKSGTIGDVETARWELGEDTRSTQEIIDDIDAIRSC